MAKDDSPEITVFMPPSEECPTVSARKIRSTELDDSCARSVVEEILLEKLGKHDWEIDFFSTPVRLEVKRKNKPPKTYEWDPSDFHCLSEFLDDLRHRLPEPDLAKFSEALQISLEDQLEWIRAACTRTTESIVEIDRMPSEADVAIEGIRDSLGLTGLRAPNRRLANLRKSDLRRVPRAERDIHRLARRVSKIKELIEVILG